MIKNMLLTAGRGVKHVFVESSDASFGSLDRAFLWQMLAFAIGLVLCASLIFALGLLFPSIPCKWKFVAVLVSFTVAAAVWRMSQAVYAEKQEEALEEYLNSVNPRRVLRTDESAGLQPVPSRYIGTRRSVEWYSWDNFSTTGGYVVLIIGILSLLYWIYEMVCH